MSKLWPDNLQTLDAGRAHVLHQQYLPDFLQLLAEERISASVDMMSLYLDLYLPFAAWLANRQNDGPLIIGINGAQGSGKSTLTRILDMLLTRAFGKRVAALSIDDLYKTRQAREQMARDIHPLFVTRGVPGTHDISLGLELLDKLRASKLGEKVYMPVFNKAADDRYPEHTWNIVEGPVDIILFEGWCVGATAETANTLHEPVNALEMNEDADGNWRRHVNAQLAGPYQQLFAAIDVLVMLEIPGMEYVFEWRSLQERKLQSALAAVPEQDSVCIMNDAQVDRFIMHYERITRRTLAEMPARANIVLKLNRDHQVAHVTSRFSS